MKRILFFIVVIVAILIVTIVVRFKIDRVIDYDVQTGDIAVPKFIEKRFDFYQFMDDSLSLPFIASAVIDINNDGVEELFIGGGPGQKDVFYEFKDNQFSRLTEIVYSKEVLDETTFASSAVDFDRNGFTDLIISRTNGVWLYLNSGSEFSARKLDLFLGNDTSPLGVAISDINRDGFVDLYVSGYIRKELVEGQNIFNKEGYGGTSRMFLNNGDDTFTNVTQSSGLYYDHNTFMGIFVDIDNDRLEDLVVAHDTGHVKTWKNIGNSQFIDMPNPNSSEYSYPMGIAVTDFGNNDTAQVFSNRRLNRRSTLQF